MKCRVAEIVQYENNPKTGESLNFNEDIIKTAISKHSRGIKRYAYICHDKDTYTEKDIKDRISRYKANGICEEKDMVLPNAGDLKPTHWHVVLDFGNSVYDTSFIAKWFNVPENNIVIPKGRGAFLDKCQYLTHEKCLDKHVYEDSEVRSNFDFRSALIAKEEGDKDGYLYQIAKRGMTIRQVMDKDWLYYVKHKSLIMNARQCYIETQDPPKTLFNYYVGTYDNDTSGTKGGIGKSLACLMLAVSLLSQMYPDIDFEHMQESDLIADGYLFRAGGAGVEYQSYDGQPVIIWEDMRSYSFIKLFGGAERFFGAFDIHPKGVKTSIKYGEVKLINKVNIINGVEPYPKFIDGLTKQYQAENGVWTESEDKSQALRRVPFFFALDPESVSITMQLNYFFSDLPTKKYKVTNSYKTAIEHKDPFRKSNLSINEPIVEEVCAIEERYEQLSKEDPPGEMFEIIEPMQVIETNKVEACPYE